jgi:hypothetical protein
MRRPSLGRLGPGTCKDAAGRTASSDSPWSLDEEQGWALVLRSSRMLMYQSVVLRVKNAVGSPQLRAYILGLRLLVSACTTLSAPFATGSTLALAPG